MLISAAMANPSTIETHKFLVPEFFATREEALQEVRRRKIEATENNLFVRCERTPYGTWRVSALPMEFLVDNLANGPHLQETVPGFSSPKKVWSG